MPFWHRRDSMINNYVEIYLSVIKRISSDVGIKDSSGTTRIYIFIYSIV